jgi:hypothetical protein
MTRCSRCKGSGMLEAQLKHLATCTFQWHIIGCPDCQGAGWRGDETGRVYTSVELHRESPYGSPQKCPTHQPCP